MYNQLVWDDKYNIGVEAIDKEHQRLFKIINKLLAFGEEKKKSEWACREGIKYFKEHAIKHFIDEENFMESINYKEKETHKNIHNGFREHTLPALEEELERTNYAPDAVDHFLGVCAGWLIGHTLTEDLAMAGEKTSKWSKRLSDKEHLAVRKAIIQLLYTMFHVEAKLISDTYGGEKFGQGVYYRLLYSTKEGKDWEVILVFEEKLLINTVGKIIGLKSNRLDTMLMNATRYTSQQLVGRIMKYFPSAELDKIKEENLLTYEQFQEVFEREEPQISLLFNTNGAGYFAYCVVSPHPLQNSVGISIETNNAMEEIEKYLTEKEEIEKELEEKPKILVVDDSLITRQSMKELLDNDYDVSSVESGLSAIRAITLEKPDLVLLDYEMPICDGRLFLAMLRSEKEFENVPVIFLTSKTDPESVKKVISLKPQGYLSKYLKPEEIKRKIDVFFNTRKLFML